MSYDLVILGFPSKAKYDILNEKGDQVLFAYEGCEKQTRSDSIIVYFSFINTQESTCCQRLILPTSRKFTLHILNNIREVFDHSLNLNKRKLTC